MCWGWESQLGAGQLGESSGPGPCRVRCLSASVCLACASLQFGAHGSALLSVACHAVLCCAVLHHAVPCCAVLQEAMRLVPVVAGGTLRTTDRPIVLGGYSLPAGTDIGIPFSGARILLRKQGGGIGGDMGLEGWGELGTAAGNWRGPLLAATWPCMQLRAAVGRTA